MSLPLRFRDATLFGLVSLLLGLVFMGTASSSPANNEELQDLGVIADAEGISVDEAVRSYGWRNALSDVVWSIGEDYPDELSESRKPSGTSAWIGFAGAVPSGVQARIDAFMTQYPHVTVELKANMGFSKKERKAAVKTVHYAVYEHAGVEDAGTRFDLGTKTIQVNAKLHDSQHASLIADLKSLAETRLVSATRPAILDAFSVSVASTDKTGTLDLDAEHRGGEQLTPYCTSGFVG